jgi:hypothetical protein
MNQRRGVYRRPLTSRSPLEGRQLWRVGDWGGASEHIGSGWERWGARSVRELLGTWRPGPEGLGYVPACAIVLHEDPELSAEMHSVGRAHADALLLGTLDGKVAIEPIDFKWTLETANPRQVSAETMTLLLDDPPPVLGARLDVAIAAIAANLERVAIDGLFLAPDNAANRAVIKNGAIQAEWTHLVVVDEVEFFRSLVDWEAAACLARLDRASMVGDGRAERYYRLGSGALGACRRLRAGIFLAPIRDEDPVAAVEHIWRKSNARSAAELIAYLDRHLTTRGELAERLRSMEREVLRFGDVRKLVGAIAPELGKLETRQLGKLHGEVVKVVAGHLRHAGGELVRSGGTDERALELLAARQPEWQSVARAELVRQVGLYRAAAATSP